MSKSTTAEPSEIKAILETFSAAFPGTTAYRYNPASIRIRIIDDRFRGKDKIEREDLVLPLLNSLPEEIQQDVMILLLLTPEETKHSLANLEFENPTPSDL